MQVATPRHSRPKLFMNYSSISSRTSRRSNKTVRRRMSSSSCFWRYQRFQVRSFDETNSTAWQLCRFESWSPFRVVSFCFTKIIKFWVEASLTEKRVAQVPELCESKPQFLMLSQHHTFSFRDIFLIEALFVRCYFITRTLLVRNQNCGLDLLVPRSRPDYINSRAMWN